MNSNYHYKTAKECYKRIEELNKLLFELYYLSDEKDQDAIQAVRKEMNMLGYEFMKQQREEKAISEQKNAEKI